VNAPADLGFPDRFPRIPILRKEIQMNLQRKVLSIGKDHTDMHSLFRSLVERTGVKKGDALTWSGCGEPCYAMATFFGYALDDLGLRQYYALEGDLKRLWRLEMVKDLGMVASRKETPVKAKVLILMSALVNVPFENVLKLVHEGLADDGIIIGETVVPGLFERLKWHERIPIRFLFEFSMQKPTVIELVERP
jgi:hypothetical protein